MKNISRETTSSAQTQSSSLYDISNISFWGKNQYHSLPITADLEE